MNTLITPENIRIYRRTDGTHTIRPEGRYVPWLSHFDGLISLTVSIYPSWTEAKKAIESTWPIALAEKAPVYLDLNSQAFPKIRSHPRSQSTNCHGGRIDLSGTSSLHGKHHRYQFLRRGARKNRLRKCNAKNQSSDPSPNFVRLERLLHEARRANPSERLLGRLRAHLYAVLVEWKWS
jgi:hypothetical protein